MPLTMSSTSPQTLVSMTATINQHRNTINRDLKTMEMSDAIKTLVKAKRCWVEAAAASKEAQYQKQIETAEKSLRRLRADVESRLKQMGWGWDELEKRAERAIGKIGDNANLSYRLTSEGSMNMDMGEM